MNNITSSQSFNITTATDRFLTPIPVLILVTSVYIAPIVSLISFLLNIICLIVLCHHKLNGDTYKYLIFKTVSHLGFLFIVATWPVHQCTTCFISLTLWAKINQYYLNLVALCVFSTNASLVEILIAYERLFMLKQQSNKYLIKLSFWPAIIGIKVISLLLNLPFMFAFRIEKVPQVDVWRLSRTAFGESSSYRTYVTLSNMLQTTGAFIVLIVMNLLVKIEFSKFMKIKKNFTMSNQANNSIDMSISLQSINDANGNGDNLRSAPNARQKQSVSINPINESTELNFTWMIIVASLLFAVTRFIQFVYVTVGMAFQQVWFNSMLIVYLNFLSFFATIVYYGSNIFIYVLFNKVFKICFREIFHI
jgi:hypothetical protein